MYPHRVAYKCPSVSTQVDIYVLNDIHKVWLPAALNEAPTSLSSLGRSFGKLKESCVVSDCAAGLRSPVSLGLTPHGEGADDDRRLSE